MDLVISRFAPELIDEFSPLSEPDTPTTLLILENAGSTDDLTEAIDQIPINLPHIESKQDALPSSFSDDAAVVSSSHEMNHGGPLPCSNNPRHFDINSFTPWKPQTQYVTASGSEFKHRNQAGLLCEIALCLDASRTIKDSDIFTETLRVSTDAPPLDAFSNPSEDDHSTSYGLLPPSSSPLPSSSSPHQIFSSSPIPSSQSSLTDYPSDHLSDSKEQEIDLDDHSNTGPGYTINSQCCLDEMPVTPSSNEEVVGGSFAASPSRNELIFTEERPSIPPARLDILIPLTASSEALQSLTRWTACSSSDIVDKVEEVTANLYTTEAANTLMRFGDTISDVLPNEVLDIGGSPSLKGAEALDDHSPANVTSNESVLEGPLTTIESPSSTSADLDSDPLSYSNKRKNENDSLDTASLVFKKPKLSPAPANIVPYYPNPKRSTLASQKLQHKKLTTPFRSPTLTLRPKLPDTTSLASNDLLTQQTFAPKPLLAHAPTSTIEQPKTSHAFVSDENDTKRKHRTQRASAPFKSPLSTDASAKLSTVRMTPIIQALERKIQLLRRAIKVKEVGEEDALLELVKKWTEAGRDIAWEVWDLVKDNASMEDQDWGKSRIGGFERSWGWDDKKTNILGSKRNWGWDIEPANPAEESGNSEKHEVMESADDNDDSEKQQDTLGTMLVQLGISPETLGWSEEEGQFRDRIYE